LGWAPTVRSCVLDKLRPKTKNPCRFAWASSQKGLKIKKIKRVALRKKKNAPKDLEKPL